MEAQSAARKAGIPHVVIPKAELSDERTTTQGGAALESTLLSPIPGSCNFVPLKDDAPKRNHIVTDINHEPSQT